MRSKQQAAFRNSDRNGTLTREPRERAFLVGVGYHQRSKNSDGDAERGKAPKLAHARAARAASMAEEDRVARFGADESLAELRELTLSAGAEVESIVSVVLLIIKQSIDISQN